MKMFAVIPIVMLVVIILTGCPSVPEVPAGLIESSISGIEISDGTYALSESGAELTYQFGGQNCRMTVGTGTAEELVRSGTWIRGTDGSLELSLSYDILGTQLVYKEKYSTGFVYEANSKSYLVLGGWEKTSGDNDTIVGNYEFWYEITLDAGAGEQTTRYTMTMEYKADHTLTATVTIGGTITSSTGTWTDDQVVQGLFRLVEFNDRTYLIGPDDTGYEKINSDAYVPGGALNEEMIVNGDFSSGMDNWVLNVRNASATVTVENEECQITITDGGTEKWNIQLYYQHGLTLVQNTTYCLSFDIRSESSRDVTYLLQENGNDVNGDGSNWTVYKGNDIPVTEEVTSYQVKFTMTEQTDTDVALLISAGSSVVDVWLDNISLEKIVPTVLNTTDVPDANLRAAFEDATGKTFGVDLTDMDLLSLDELIIPDYGITDITGLELCDNVGFLLLDENPFVSLIPLEGMDMLRAINLWDCTEISDISILVNLPELMHIQLARNDLNINDYSIFTHDNFPDLIRLSMDGYDETTGQVKTNKMNILNFLSSYSDLEDLGLYRFYLSDVEFTDLYNQVLVLNNSSLDRLFLDCNNLTNDSMASISNLNNLKRLVLSNNSDITNISAFANMSNLRFLDLNGTGVADLSPLEDLYDNGGFSMRSNDDYDILIINCNLDLRSGTSNRDVVDYLIDHDVRVDYKDGNQLD